MIDWMFDMRKHWFEVVLVLFLILLTGLLYSIHIGIFHDIHHLALFGLEDLAFLPIEVLIVTLFLDRLLKLRDRKERAEKINMVIGVYFSEIGNLLFRAMASYDVNIHQLRKEIHITHISKDKDLKKASQFIKRYNTKLKVDVILFEELKLILSQKRDLLSNIIQNPVLLEHGSFTDLLLATFHLEEELSYRDNLSKLPQSDIAHLNGDVKRAYLKIAEEWIKYLKHLKGNYPYLYSLSFRLNPLNKEIDITVRK